jgi:hypothetical protein
MSTQPKGPLYQVGTKPKHTGACTNLVQDQIGQGDCLYQVGTEPAITSSYPSRGQSHDPLYQVGTRLGLFVPSWYKTGVLRALVPSWYKRRRLNTTTPNQPSLARAEFFWASENVLETAMT